MATRLTEGQSLKRLVRIHGIGEVEVTMSEEGIGFRAPGTKIGTHLNWSQAALHSQTPTNVKSYHMGKPVEFLESQVKKGEESRAKKHEKKQEGK